MRPASCTAIPGLASAKAVRRACRCAEAPALAERGHTGRRRLAHGEAQRLVASRCRDRAAWH